MPEAAMTEEEFARALKTVDWANLQHCYGPAGNVPDLMLALFEDADRAGASDPPPMPPVERLMLAIFNPSALPPEPPNPCGQLFDCLYHQGDIYQATVAAVPFIIELVRQPRTRRHHRELLLLLESCLEDGFRYPHGVDPSSPRYAYWASQAENGEQTYWAAQEGIPLYVALLNDERPEIRIASAAVLRKCRERAGEILPHLRERLSQETEPEPRGRAPAGDGGPVS